MRGKLALRFLLIIGLMASSAPSPTSSAADPQRPFSTAQSAASPLPDHPLPRGFQSYNDSHSSGRILFVKFSGGERSARVAMRGYLAILNSYFDGPPQLLAAVGDPQDQVVQVILSANLQGQPVRGVATVALGQSDATFGLIFDRPNSLQTSFLALSQKLGQEMPKSSSSGPVDLSSPKSWRRQTGGDRSAAVDLPSGWQITTCSQGILTIAGPHQELIQLGLIFFVSTIPGSQGMASPYLQPVPAFSYFVNYSTRVNLQNGVRIQNIPGRVLEVKAVPAPMPNGRGAYLLQETSTNGQGYKVFALVYTAPNLMTGWTLYTSYVAAPADLFPSEFADLMRIWSSWKVDDRVYQEQMRRTLESMNETRDIISRGENRQMHAYDNLEENMGLIMRGEDRVENRSLGGRSDVYTQDTDGVLRSCQKRGYDCRRVPFDELTQH
jgi:hypothetical protein